MLYLWEINMNNKLVAAVEDILLSKEKAKNINLKDNFYINSDVLLLNIKEIRNLQL